MGWGTAATEESDASTVSAFGANGETLSPSREAEAEAAAPSLSRLHATTLVKILLNLIRFI
jgi:hypothetical protein